MTRTMHAVGYRQNPAGSVTLIPPGVSGSVLNHKVALPKVDLFRVELEPDLP
jgi:hypothetical protein